MPIKPLDLPSALSILRGDAALIAAKLELVELQNADTNELLTRLVDKVENLVARLEILERTVSLHRSGG